MGTKAYSTGLIKLRVANLPSFSLHAAVVIVRVGTGCLVGGLA